MTDLSAGEAKREVVLVMGMHRSGTSAFTRVCNLLGGALPEPLVEPAIGNELGHWEPAEVVAMNDRALLAAGSDVNSVTPLSTAWSSSEAGARFSAEVEGFVRGLGAEPKTWFVKDPRISILGRLWRKGVEQAGVEPKVVILFRDPWEVAQSLSKRQLHHFPDEVWPVERGLALWLNYTLAAEKASRGLPRTFVSYDRLLRDWRAETARAYAQLELAKPDVGADREAEIDAFIRPDERHARHDGAQHKDDVVSRVFDLLQARIEDPDGGRLGFNEASEAFAGAFDLLGGYMRALEARAGEVGVMRARAMAAEREVGDLQHDLDRAELRLNHLVRRQDERPVLSGDPEPLESLQAKHAALLLAHGENVAAYQADVGAMQVEIEALRRARQESLEASAEQLRAHEKQLTGLRAHLASEQAAHAATGLAHADSLRLHLRAVDDAEGARAALVEAHVALDAMRHSRSWRMTRPVRALSRLLGRG